MRNQQTKTNIDLDAFKRQIAGGDFRDLVEQLAGGPMDFKKLFSSDGTDFRFGEPPDDAFRPDPFARRPAVGIVVINNFNITEEKDIEDAD